APVGDLDGLTALRLADHTDQLRVRRDVAFADAQDDVADREARLVGGTVRGHRRQLGAAAGGILAVDSHVGVAGAFDVGETLSAGRPAAALGLDDHVEGRRVLRVDREPRTTPLRLRQAGVDPLPRVAAVGALVEAGLLAEAHRRVVRVEPVAHALVHARVDDVGVLGIDPHVDAAGQVVDVVHALPRLAAVARP